MHGKCADPRAAHDLLHVAGMWIAVQARLVDAIKRRAITLSLASPPSEAWLLAGYLFAEEQAEGLALTKTILSSGPSWLARMIERQLADEARHATLLRGRLTAIGEDVVPLRAGAMLGGKMWLLERLCDASADQFASGRIVPLLACAAQLERTGVRVFARHLRVLEERGRHDDDTTAALRSILADEERHVKGCAGALARLITPEERPALVALERRIARVDRALGVSSSLVVLAIVAAQRVKERLS
jgi:hypothetical protein